MNEFERRWKLGATAARAAGDEPPPVVPFGFATRVVAAAQSAPVPALATLWQHLAWRALGGVAAALAAMIALDAAMATEESPLTAEVANTVSELFWLQE